MSTRLLAVGVASLLIVWSCTTDRNPAAATSAARTDVLLTDAPADAGLGSVNVYIDHIDASATTDTTGGPASQPWTTIVAPHRSYDLLTLQNGATALLGTTEISAAQFVEIRVALNTDLSSLVRSDGTPATVHWGTMGETTVHVLVEAPAQIGPNAQILLDFNVANSFVPDPQDPNAFLFIPWIRAVVSNN